MFKKTLVKAIPLAVLLFAGGVAMAQAPSSAPSANEPAGTTKPQNNAVNPAPTAGTNSNSNMGSTNMGSSSMTNSGTAPASGAIAGTTKPQNNIVNPAPRAGKNMKSNKHKSKRMNRKSNPNSMPAKQGSTY